MKTGTLIAGSVALATSFSTGHASAQILECLLESDTANVAEAICPAGHAFATGGGFWSASAAAVNYAAPAGPFVADLYEVDFIGAGSGVAMATCCNLSAGPTVVYSATNVATASCNGKVAVGGGGYCQDPAGRLTFSHPLPFSTGSTPTQWTARCNTPGVWAVANCTIQDAYDTCRVKRTVNASGKTAVATCFDDEVVTSGGAWCATGSIRGMNYSGIGPLNQISAGCSTNDTHAFAVCCEGFAVD